MASGAHGPLPCSRLSLRFANKEVEAGFLASRRPFLLHRLKLTAGLYLGASAASLVALPMLGHPNDRPGGDHQVLRESLFMALASMALVVGLVVLLLLVVCAKGAALAARGHFCLEAAATALLALVMASWLISQPKRFVKIRGFGLREVFGSPYDSDSSLLLGVLTVVVVGHLGLPVRWCVVAPLEALALVVYALNAIVVGSEEPRDHVIMNFQLLTVLIGLCASSRRSSELEERAVFLGMVRERALRYQAEYQLSQVAVEEVLAQGCRSEGRSEGTDRSGAVFDVHPDVGGERPWRAVAAKGEAEHWRIPASEVRLLSEAALGRGGFGTVKRAVFCGDLVAVKCPNVELGTVRIPELCNELRVLRHLRHPHIVSAHGAVVLPEEEQLFLVLELIEGKDLASFLAPPGPQSAAPGKMPRYQVMLGVCRALLYMHTRLPHIVHGDLKSSNILVEAATDGGAFPRLLDFGLSRVLRRKPRALGGTLAWMAPEVLDRAPVRCSADIYSLGHVLAFTATSVPPSRARGSSHALQAMLGPAVAPWPSGCGLLACRPLAQACLRLQEDQRPAIAEVHAALLNVARELDLEKRDAGHLHVVRAITDAMDAGRRGYLERLSLVARASEEGRSTELLRFAKERCLKPGRLESVREEDGREAQTGEPPTAAAAAGAGVADGNLEPLGTSRAAMLASLESHLQHWSSAAPSTACCDRHARLQLALELCGEALAGACGPLEPPAQTQCVTEEQEANTRACSPAEPVPKEAVSARHRRASL